MPQRKRIDKAAPSPLGQYIIAARKRQGWSRKQLAESASIPYTTLRNIETEQQSVKTNESYLQAIAHTLDVPFDELRVLCKHDVWASGEIVTGLPVDLSGSVRRDGYTSPMLQVTCQNCRYIALFEAGPMGLIGVRPQRNG